jgi:hypothetical protein
MHRHRELHLVGRPVHHLFHLALQLLNNLHSQFAADLKKRLLCMMNDDNDYDFPIAFRLCVCVHLYNIVVAKTDCAIQSQQQVVTTILVSKNQHDL